MLPSWKLLACGAFTLAVNAAVAQKKQLTNDQYFKGNFKSIVQPLPVVRGWIDDTHLQLSRDGKNYILDAVSGAEQETPANTKDIGKGPERPAVYSQENDLFIKLDSAVVQLTNDEEKEVNPTMSPDGNYVAFTKKNDLYTINVKTKKQTRITEDGSETILNGYASWVYTEEILGRSSTYRAFWWSPDSKHLAYFRTDDSQVPVFTLTDANGIHGYVENVRYPKVGDKNPQVKIGIVVPEARSGDIKWAEFNPKDDQYFGMPYWKPDGSSLLVQWMNRKQDNLKIWEVDPANGSKTLFYNEQQETWVDLDDEGQRIRFLGNGKGFILFSDSSGWNHMYFHAMNGKRLNAITSGKYNVSAIEFIDEATGTVYFSGRKEHSTRKDIYRVNLDGKKLQRLSFGDFNHSTVLFSPNGNYFVTTYSNVYTPAKMAVVSSTGKIVKELGTAKAREYDDYALAKTEIIYVKSQDGLFELPMKVTWPLNMDKAKKYPVLINTYGGPDRANVMDNFTLGGTQQWYAKEELIQVSMDHRGSGHFGKAGVNYLYHKLGYWEMKDYSTMVEWLIANGNADSNRVCITGFSYGGYLTCYALTNAADVFTHGMAGGSVTDWQLYDTHYTERFMGTNADNKEGYRNSSVLTWADKYKGMLQIVHGVIDDNVHMQNSIQLISKLQDQKKDFEFMVYSGGRHGWGGSKGAHFQNLKTKFIYKYLLRKEVPQEILK